MQFDIGVFGAEVVTPAGLKRTEIGVKGGKFLELSNSVNPADCERVIDGAGLIALPGIIDAHNHPYYDDDILEFGTSAAFGGITSMISFAGTNIAAQPKTAQFAPQVVADFISRAGSTVPLDYAVHAIVGENDPPAETVEELLQLGVTSLKMFMAFPGKRMLTDSKILEFMQAAARLGVLCMVHCENGPVTELLETQTKERGETRPLDYARSRPVEAESEAIYRALSLAEIAGCDCYIVHVSSAQSLEVIREFRGRGRIQVWAETCPHYLLLTEADLESKAGLAKISPPLRRAEDVSALWSAVEAGEIDVIASDCSGQKMDPKMVENIFDAPFGIPGVEHMLPLIWHHAVNERKLDPSIVADKMSDGPARAFGLTGKGRIAQGYDADLVLMDPNAEWTISAERQHGNSDYSLYEGWKVRGRPLHSIRGGMPLLEDGELVKEAPPGRYLPRSN